MNNKNNRRKQQNGEIFVIHIKRLKYKNRQTCPPQVSLQPDGQINTKNRVFLEEKSNRKEMFKKVFNVDN